MISENSNTWSSCEATRTIKPTTHKPKPLNLQSHNAQQIRWKGKSEKLTWKWKKNRKPLPIRSCDWPMKIQKEKCREIKTYNWERPNKNFLIQIKRWRRDKEKIWTVLGHARIEENGYLRFGLKNIFWFMSDKWGLRDCEKVKGRWNFLHSFKKPLALARDLINPYYAYKLLEVIQTSLNKPLKHTHTHKHTYTYTHTHKNTDTDTDTQMGCL